MPPATDRTGNAVQLDDLNARHLQLLDQLAELSDRVEAALEQRATVAESP